MQIDLSAEHKEKAAASIRFSLEFGSNVMDRRDMQEVKQCMPMISIDAGRQIDARVQQL
jgi:hypothetical protein